MVAVDSIAQGFQAEGLRSNRLNAQIQGDLQDYMARETANIKAGGYSGGGDSWLNRDPTADNLVWLESFDKMMENAVPVGTADEVSSQSAQAANRTASVGQEVLPRGTVTVSEVSDEELAGIRGNAFIDQLKAANLKNSANLPPSLMDTFTQASASATGDIYAINGNGWDGLLRRNVKAFTGDLIFPDKVTAAEEKSLLGRFRSIYGGNDTVANSADIEAYNNVEVPLLGIKNKQLFDSAEVTVGVLGLLQGGFALSKMVQSAGTFGTDLLFTKNLTSYGTTVIDEIAALRNIGENSRAWSIQRASDLELIDAARATQGSGRYSGVDSWIGVKTYQPGDVIYAILPNKEYFTTANTLRVFGDDAASIGQSLQVAPGGPLKQYRDTMGVFEVTQEFRAPVGIVKSNPQWGGGSSWMRQSTFLRT